MLYEDDGVSNIDKNLCRMTNVSYDEDEKSISVNTSNMGYYDGIEKRNLTFEIRGGEYTGAECESHRISFEKGEGCVKVTVHDVSCLEASEVIEIKLK